MVHPREYGNADNRSPGINEKGLSLLFYTHHCELTAQSLISRGYIMTITPAEIKCYHEIVQKITGTYTELRMQGLTANSIVLSGRQIDTLSSGTTQTGSIRLYHKGAWSFVSFNDFDNIEYYASRALEIAGHLQGERDSGLKRSQPVQIHHRTSQQIPLSEVSFDEKFELASAYNRILHGHEKVQTTRSIYRDYEGWSLYLNSDGSEVFYEKAMCGVGLSSVAKDGAIIQPFYDSFAGYGGFEYAKSLDTEAEKIVKMSVDLLGAEQIEGGTYNIVTDPDLSGVFIHEAFGHLSEADFLYENEQMRKQMVNGRKLGIESLNVVDDGSMKDKMGFIPCDDEGVAPQKTYLVKNGILNAHLHSRETAHKMEEPLTGNARAISPLAQPIVRMTNTYIENGPHSEQEIFDALGDGIYAVDMYGGQTNLEMFTFSAVYGVEVKNGKKGRLLKNVMLSGNVFETIASISMIGNDLSHSGGLGGCGKGGQSPLPVTTGGPHLLIKNVLIGGAQQ